MIPDAQLGAFKQAAEWLRRLRERKVEDRGAGFTHPVMCKGGLNPGPVGPDPGDPPAFRPQEEVGRVGPGGPVGRGGRKRN